MLEMLGDGHSQRDSALLTVMSAATRSATLSAHAGVQLKSTCKSQQHHKMGVHWRCLFCLLAAYALMSSLSPAVADDCMTIATFNFCPDAAAAAAALLPAVSTQFTISNAVFSGICNASTVGTTYMGQLGVINDFGPCHLFKVGHQTNSCCRGLLHKGDAVCACRTPSARTKHA
jgi:hypothetical protein